MLISISDSAGLMEPDIHSTEIITPRFHSAPGLKPCNNLWLTWTTLVTALPDFLPVAVALLPGLRCPLTHTDSPLPSTIAGLRATAPRTPRVPLAVRCNRSISQLETDILRTGFGFANKTNITFIYRTLLSCL